MWKQRTQHDQTDHSPRKWYEMLRLMQGKNVIRFTSRIHSDLNTMYARITSIQKHQMRVAYWARKWWQCEQSRGIHHENESERFCAATREADDGLHEPNPLILEASELKADEERRERWTLAEAEAIWTDFLVQVAAMPCAVRRLCAKDSPYPQPRKQFTIQPEEGSTKGLFLGLEYMKWMDRSVCNGPCC